MPGNERDTRLFSHHLPRPLTAHQMADALAQATDVANRFPGVDATRRAIEVPDPMTASPILDTFGRCSRTVALRLDPRRRRLRLRQALLLIGGDVIESKVSSLNGYLASALEARARARRAGRKPLFPHRLPAPHRRRALALGGRAETGFVEARGGRRPVLGAA